MIKISTLNSDKLPIDNVILKNIVTISHTCSTKCVVSTKVHRYSKPDSSVQGNSTQYTQFTATSANNNIILANSEKQRSVTTERILQWYTVQDPSFQPTCLSLCM